MSQRHLTKQIKTRRHWGKTNLHYPSDWGGMKIIIWGKKITTKTAHHPIQEDAKSTWQKHLVPKKNS